MTAPKEQPKPRINHNVNVDVHGDQPMLRCGYCGDWITLKAGTVVHRLIELAAFWSKLHNHYSR